MADRFDPPRNSDWQSLPMRPDIAGQYVHYSDLAAARAEIERLTKERDEARAERDALMADPLYIIGVNHGWDEAVENDVAHPAARPMQSMLADAERDMRQRAAETACPCDTGEGAYDAILALPLKHADREG